MYNELKFIAKLIQLFIGSILVVTPLLSFVYTGVIYYEKKDSDWIVILSVVKEVESHLTVMILH